MFYTMIKLDIKESILKHEGSIAAFEFKWNEREVKVPSAFKASYPDVSFETISRLNFLEWVIQNQHGWK
jgi:hypothetical protein